MKAFPECWVSSFFITLYSSRFSLDTNGIVSMNLTFLASFIRFQETALDINCTYHAHFFIEDVSQVGDILEHRNIATNPAVGANPALS